MYKGVFMKSLLLIALFSSASLFANSAFEKRFEVSYKDNNAVQISIRGAQGFHFSLQPYLSLIKKILIEEQNQINTLGYTDEIHELLGEEFIDLSNPATLQGGQMNRSRANSMKTRDIKNIVDALRELSKYDFNEIFSDPKFIDTLSQLEVRMNKALSYINPNVLARMDDSRFFYKKNVIEKVSKWGLNLAKNQLSVVPVLNTALYVIDKISRMLQERRLFMQNMLLHYLQNSKPEELGMNISNVRHALSSIYESQIPWFMFWESNKAKKDWDGYGAKNFSASMRGANRTLVSNFHRYESVDNRINFAFQDVYINDELGKAIINLFDSEAMFTSKPAVAYYYDKPGKVKRKRVLLQLAELGLSFLTIPNFLKSQISKYIGSFYYRQVITEGSLVGYFEDNGREKMRDMILSQTVNPYLKSE